MERWKFGAGQTVEDERAEIEAAKAAGLEFEYLHGQKMARMIEAETERRRARHGSPTRQINVDPRLTALPTPEEVEAARTGAGGWSRATLSRWGVPWPPPKGWRRALEAQRTGGAPRPPGWSDPVLIRQLDGFEEEAA